MRLMLFLLLLGSLQAYAQNKKSEAMLCKPWYKENIEGSPAVSDTLFCRYDIIEFYPDHVVRLSRVLNSGMRYGELAGWERKGKDQLLITGKEISEPILIQIARLTKNECSYRIESPDGKSFALVKMVTR